MQDFSASQDWLGRLVQVCPRANSIVHLVAHCASLLFNRESRSGVLLLAVISDGLQEDYKLLQTSTGEREHVYNNDKRNKIIITQF